MNWDDLSDEARAVMEELGNLSPTVNVQYKEVKGYTLDSESGEGGKTYWSSDDLRTTARACDEVAAWLDKRAELDANKGTK